jgi:hypothetical protein
MKPGPESRDLAAAVVVVDGVAAEVVAAVVEVAAAVVEVAAAVTTAIDQRRKTPRFDVSVKNQFGALTQERSLPRELLGSFAYRPIFFS